MEYTQAEILQTVRMTEMEHLDVRTVTLGLSLRDCVRAGIEETAEAVRVSHTTVERDWKMARAWLRRELDR